jgi:hypothetical protein
MAKIVVICIIIIISEVVIAFCFALAAQLLYHKIGLDVKSIVKGIIERVFLLIALLNNYPHALTLFSALKLGTRLKHKEPPDEENRYNDYYLIGNLVSVAVAIWYVYLCQNFDEIKMLHSMAN